MLRWTMPSETTMQQWIVKSRSRDFTYENVGATRGSFPTGYRIGRHVAEVGRGFEDFKHGSELLARWQQFDLPWLRLNSSDNAVEGAVVLVIAKILGVTTVNPCRVVYATHTDDVELASFSYACGTLPGHDVQGEERFELEWCKSTDRVTFRIESFSRPFTLPAKTLAFIARQKQRQFRHESAIRLRELISLRRESQRSDKLANC